MSRITYIKSLIYDLLPGFVRNRIRVYSDNKKIKHWQECFKVKVDKEQVDALFREMAIDSDVMIHSSLPEIGNVRLRDVMDDLKEYVTDKGNTILCPALPVKGSSLDYLKSIDSFDVRSAPNAMGSISSHYGKKTDAVRSLSPTHSVVALGPQASYYTEEHHLDETPFTERSPYYKLMLRDGKILMFGASLKHLTFCHVLEDIIGEEDFPVKVYDQRRFSLKLVDKSGGVTHGTFRAHSRNRSRLSDPGELIEAIRQLPSTKVFHLGCGEVVLIDARDVMICMLKSLKCGVTTLGKRKVSQDCKRKADEWIAYIRQL